MAPSPFEGCTKLENILVEDGHIAFVPLMEFCLVRMRILYMTIQLGEKGNHILCLQELRHYLCALFGILSI